MPKPSMSKEIDYNENETKRILLILKR